MTEKFFIISELLDEFQLSFQKRGDMIYDVIKSHKKPGFYSLFRKYIFGRTTGQRVGCQIDLIVVLRLDIKYLRKYFDKLYPLLRNRCSVGKKLQRLFSFVSPVPVLICAGKYPCSNFYGYRILD